MVFINDYSHIIVMKAGPYCGYSLDEIIHIKQQEANLIGKFFWGYGGVFCQPKVVNAFVSHSFLSDCQPYVMFCETLSAYETNSGGKFTDFSINKSSWKHLPEEVLLIGNKKKTILLSLHIICRKLISI